ncbi:MAG: peptide chain release factor 2 [Desulfobacterales bacterium S3730MH5]|nr:MAG: peptide chain release factor 2 [Desulfobacterales bacterium S3730MH5]OEU80010.1 MAG: peptide chain release factor 2 [Desulfobacterales bacterium S5133MH4]
MISKKEFWDVPEETKEILKERSTLSGTLNSWQKLHHELEDAEVLLGLAREEDDQSAMQEVSEILQSLEDAIDKMALARMLSGKDDAKNAIISINAGAGGTEAQDWAEMLFRMYLRWAERKNYETSIVDIQYGEEAGIKGVTFIASGPYAYGYLKGETGIHRLVRISPFDATNRRHTSFASVSVSSEVSEEVIIDIDENDLRIDTFRASGAGGQHVNKTSSAVRIMHLPTGIITQCQQESSQHRNKAIAMKILRSRLHEDEQRKRADEKQAQYESKDEIAWGSQIRSYTLQPYQMVKDHRIDLEIGNVNSVLDGNLDALIEGVLLARA